MSLVVEQVQRTTVIPELAHRPPQLTVPTVISLAPAQRCPTLDPTRDYIVRLPDEPYQRGLWLIGGRNIVVVGGEIQVAATGDAREQRAIYTKDCRGTLYLEGQRFTGPNTQDVLCIDKRYPGDVVVQNWQVDQTYGTQAGFHADVIQTWAGPSRLLVDHLHARVGYQGFFLLPGQQWSAWPGDTTVDLRHVHIESLDSSSAYALWCEPATVPVSTHDVWVTVPEPPRADERDWRLWPKGDARWGLVRLGQPPFPMVDQGSLGVGYRSVWADLNA